MNNIYIYNTFINLLNLIELLINNKIKPYNIKDESYYRNLFDNIINLEQNNNIDIIPIIIKKIGIKNFNIIYKVFLSNENNKELIIYYFYLNYLKYKEKVLYMKNLKCVNKALKISKHVGNEAHKLKGFVRFKELKNNVLYAEIEPTNNILEIISLHFKKRMPNEYWCICDNKRNIISIYNKEKIIFIPKDKFNFLTNELSNNENNIENLWTTFYKTIGIETRKNDRCRMNFMPKKYWKYIIEMKEEL